jgi:hypothetical protein
MRIDELLNSIESSSNDNSIYLAIISEGEPIKVEGSGDEELQFDDESQYQDFIKERGLDTGSSENIRLLEFHIKH